MALKTGILALLLLLLYPSFLMAQPDNEALNNEPHKGLSRSSPPESCKGCHAQIYDDWKDSFHAKSTTSPAFRGMFTIFDFSTQGKAPQECLNCHSAESKYNKNYQELRQAILDDQPNTPGTTCAACHGITEVDDVPDLLVPVTNHPVTLPAHNVEKGELFKKSVMCSSCHDYNNAHAVQGDWRKGVPCCDTNRDFRRTEMAKRGVTCQSCHMADGLDKNPTAWKDTLTESSSLKQAVMRWLNLEQYTEDKTLKGHRFPGSHDAPMLKSAFDIQLETVREGYTVSAEMAIKNLTGHSIPNGCPPRARIFLKVWLEDSDGFEIDGRQIEYGINFKDKNGNQPAMVDTAVSRGFDQVFEAEKTEQRQFKLSLEEADDNPVFLKASMTYVHFVMPPSEAQNRMQQGLIKRIKAGSDAEKKFILDTEIPGRMAAMNQLSSAYKPIVIWQAKGKVTDKGVAELEIKQ
tara:strand:+ start:1190 stop:2575 length:1386 start_codon:yes stop_codon:yes gene_type:complete